MEEMHSAIKLLGELVLREQNSPIQAVQSGKKVLFEGAQSFQTIAWQAYQDALADSV